MHAELCKIDQSFSTAFYLRRRLHGGVWGLYRPTLDPNLGIVATRAQSSTRCGRFRTHGRKCPQQCWRQRQCSWDVSNYLGPGYLLARCGGRYRIFGVITISIPTGRTGHAERNSCAMWVGGVVVGGVVCWVPWIADNQVSGRCERVLHRSFGRRSVVVECIFFFFFSFGRSGRAGLGWGLGC